MGSTFRSLQLSRRRENERMTQMRGEGDWDALCARGGEVNLFYGWPVRDRECRTG